MIDIIHVTNSQLNDYPFDYQIEDWLTDYQFNY